MDWKTYTSSDLEKITFFLSTLSERGSLSEAEEREVSSILRQINSASYRKDSFFDEPVATLYLNKEQAKLLNKLGRAIWGSE